MIIWNFEETIGFESSAFLAIEGNDDGEIFIYLSGLSKPMLFVQLAGDWNSDILKEIISDIGDEVREANHVYGSSKS